MNKLTWKKVGIVTPEYDGFVMARKYKIIKVAKAYKVFAIHNNTGVEKIVPLFAQFLTLKEAKEALQKKLDLLEGV